MRTQHESLKLQREILKKQLDRAIGGEAGDHPNMIMDVEYLVCELAKIDEEIEVLELKMGIEKDDEVSGRGVPDKE